MNPERPNSQHTPVEPSSPAAMPTRLRILTSGARSSAKRYPAYLLARPAKSSSDQGSFRAEWESLPDGNGLVAASWLGHCSVLLKIGKTTILTDPVFSNRVGIRLPGITLGPQRLIPVPLLEKDMPRLDLVLLSHAHFDHLDRPTLRRLAQQHTQVVAAARTGDLVPRGFGDVQELDWDQTRTVAGLSLSALRPAHWGARTVWDRHRGYNSYLITPAETSGSLPVLFAGDTANTAAYRGIGPCDLGIFGIGAYDPWIHAHANPEQVWQMAQDAQCRLILPVHHSTFKLSDEPLDEPLTRLVAAAGTDGVIVPPTPGEIHRFGSAPRTT